MSCCPWQLLLTWAFEWNSVLWDILFPHILCCHLNSFSNVPLPTYTTSGCSCRGIRIAVVEYLYLSYWPQLNPMILKRNWSFRAWFIWSVPDCCVGMSSALLQTLQAVVTMGRVSTTCWHVRILWRWLHSCLECSPDRTGVGCCICPFL